MKNFDELNNHAKLLLNSVNLIDETFLKRKVQKHNKKVMKYIEIGREVRFRCGIIFIEEKIYQDNNIPANKYINKGNNNIYFSGRYRCLPHINHYSNWSKWEK